MLKLSVPQSTLSCFYPARARSAWAWRACAQTGVSPEKWPLAQKKIQNPKKSFQEKGPLSNSRWCWVFVFPVERESFPEVGIRIETGIGLLSRDMPLAVEPPLLRFGAPSIHLDFYWKLFSGHPVPVNENLRQLEKGTRATNRRCAADHCLCFVVFLMGPGRAFLTLGQFIGRQGIFPYSFIILLFCTFWRGSTPFSEKLFCFSVLWSLHQWQFLRKSRKWLEIIFYAVCHNTLSTMPETRGGRDWELKTKRLLNWS